MKANKKSLYQEGGSVAKDSINPVVNELSDVIKNNIENGGSPEEILKTFLLQGIPVDQLTLAFESAGLDPSSFGELLQNVEMMIAQEEQAQQQPQQAAPVEPSMMQPQNEEQPPMRYGGNVSSGYLSPTTQDERPIYMPPVPAKGNVLGAAFLLDDAAGKFFGTSDKDGDGLMDGTFKDWEAKNARYKQKQLGNRSYKVDYGSNNPNDYLFTYEDLSKGKLRTNEEMISDIAKYSRLDFDPESNQYTGGYASSENEAKTFGKNQYKNTIGLQDFLDKVSDYSKEDKKMLLEAMKYDKGRGMFMNEEGGFGSYSPETQANLTERQRRAQQNSFRDIMLGNQRLTPDTTPQIEESKTPVNYNQRSIVTIPNSDKPIVANIPDFRTWYAENSQSLMGKSQAEAKKIYDNTEFKYGGGLPKAQLGIPDMNSLSAFVNQYSLPDMNKYLQNQGQTDYARDTQIVADAQLQQRQPNLGPTPFEQQTQEDFGMTTPSVSNAQTNTNIPENASPTVTRKRSVGNALDQAETFIKDNPAMRAFGDVSDFAVKGANLVNEMFQQKEFNDYKNKLRNTTVADNIYLATENPVNKRGTFDANSGLAEPDNLVDYYAQAMYGKELYKSGGEFQPHMMFDPVSGKGYKANVEADHNRFAKLGFLHQDEMQDGGSVTPQMKEYLKALAFNKEARQAIGTDNTEKLKQLGFDKPYNNNDLTRDFGRLQELRKAAGLGVSEEASILFPHVGQQMRGTVNSWLGTNFEQGGEVEIDNDTLAALIAAGADIEIL